MGWEWRVFYAGNIEGSFLAHADEKLPLVEADGASSKSDSRFDVYVSVTEDTGIKVRGDLSSPDIEVKTRKERTSKGLEKWRKVHALFFLNLQSHFFRSNAICYQVITTRKETGGDKDEASLLEDVKGIVGGTTWNEATSMAITVHKRRVCYRGISR
jgi:hypothetical protein